MTKLSADREVRQLYHQAELELEDFLAMRVRQLPFKQSHFPYLFLFMDSPHKFEVMYELIHGQEISSVSGRQMIDGLSFPDKHRVLQLALSATLGDKIKELAYDRFGNILDETQVANPSVSVHCRVP